MDFPQTQIGGIAISRLIIGSNTFHGFSHFSAARDQWLRQYFILRHRNDVSPRSPRGHRPGPGMPGTDGAGSGAAIYPQQGRPGWSGVGERGPFPHPK